MGLSIKHQAEALTLLAGMIAKSDMSDLTSFLERALEEREKVGAAKALRHAWPGAEIREGISYEALADVILKKDK